MKQNEPQKSLFDFTTDAPPNEPMEFRPQVNVGVVKPKQISFEGDVVVKQRHDYAVREYEMFMDKEVLDENRKKREEIVKKFGFIPQSILPFGYRDRDRRLDQLVDDRLGKGSYQENTSDNPYMKGTVYEGEFRGLSQYSPKVAKFVIQMWGVDGGLLCDPHTGRLPRLLLGNNLGMNTVGFDVWGLTHRLNAEKMRERVLSAGKLFPDNNKLFTNNGMEFRCMYNSNLLTFYCRDNRVMDMLPNGSVDFVFTSPPFWDVEKYGDEKEQLGNTKTYKGFLDNMRETMRECYRISKPDSFIAWDVNDFRKGGVYYPYHADSIKLLEEVGYKMWDNICYFIGDISKIFAMMNLKQKKVAKVHCYVIVAKKGS